MIVLSVLLSRFSNFQKFSYKGAGLPWRNWKAAKFSTITKILRIKLLIEVMLLRIRYDVRHPKSSWSSVFSREHRHDKTE